MSQAVLNQHSHITVGAAQYPIDELDNLDAWRDKVADWVNKGADQGAQLLVFPEYAAVEQAGAMGREVSSDLKATLHMVAALKQDRIAHHIDLARALNVHILIGSGPVMDGSGTYTNDAQLVTPQGGIGIQQKLMMTPFEKDWGVTAGNQISLFDTDLGRIGIAICYDIEFPLIARAMANAGADIILVPSCTERISGYHRVRTGAMARALENTIATVQSPTVGDALWSPAVDTNVGAAGFYVPAEHNLSETGVLAQGTPNEPGWVVCDINLEKLRAARKTGEMRNFSDWTNQPGGQNAKSPPVKVVTLNP